MSLDLVDQEIGRHDWAAMECGCGGSAEHLVPELRALAGAGKVHHITDHILPMGEMLVETSLPVLRVLLVIIASDPPGAHRHTCFWHVAALLEEDHTSRGDRDLAPDLRAVAREALDLFYAEVRTVRNVGTANDCVDILRALGEDPEYVDSQWRADED